MLTLLVVILSAAVIYDHAKPTYNDPVVFVSDTGEKYHKQDCPTLDGNGIPVDLEDALNMGKEPCKICIN